MNIGDKVRILHGNESGVITKISSGGMVEIEIEDGFRIPVHRREVVVVSAVEKQYFGGAQAPSQTPSVLDGGTVSGEGVFLGYIPLNDKDHSIYICNDSVRTYFVLVAEIFGENCKTLLADKIGPNGSMKVGEKSIADFEEWPMLLVQLFPIHEKIEKQLPSIERRIKFKASSFFKSKGKIPVLGKNGYVFKLSENTKEINVQELNAELNEGKMVEQPTFKKPPREIDLHIEKLVEDHSKMSNSEMLRLQLKTFETNLNQAIASGMDEITFVHGIGNGVLRKEIHKILSQMGNIKYFQDSQKDRFGYGATLVRIS